MGPIAVTKRQVGLGLAGAVLMPWGGQYIAAHLNGPSTASLHVVTFALGIFCFTGMAVAGLGARVDRLERELRRRDAPTTSPDDV